jgi:catechol 2,3-dioxygenase-like lactoylglutathione lyase family enzyme
MMNRLIKITSLPLVIGALFYGVALSQQPPADNAQPPPVTGLVPDHATLSVESIEREAEWYERVLGFKVFSKSPPSDHDVNWHLVIPGYRIDLFKMEGSKRPAPVDPIYLQQGWIHLSFHVEDVAAALKTLQALHVNVNVRKDGKGNPIQLTFVDPEGNALEIRRNLLV